MIRLCLSCLVVGSILIGLLPVKAGALPATTNIDQLRKMFVQTFGADFELASDKTSDGKDGKYWVVTVKAKRSGSFTFRYKFQRLNYGYKFADNEYRVEVGEKACKRMLFFGFHPDMCVGDSIVLHIDISDYVVKHKFLNAGIYKTSFTSSYTGLEGLQAHDVENPLMAHLKFLGGNIRPSIYRDLRTVAVDFRAVFEAREPGNVNLQLSATVPELLREYYRPDEINSIPITIVAETEPITMVANEEHLWESDDAPDQSYDPRSGSLGGKNHYSDLLMLHTGDRVSLTYCGMKLPTGKDLEKVSNGVKPVIKCTAGCQPAAPRQD
jgi:hypothetical protein